MEQAGQGIVWAKIQGFDTVEFMLASDVPGLQATDITIVPRTKVKALRQQERKVVLTTSPLKLTESYTLRVRGVGEKELCPDGILDQFYSDKPLGCHVQRGRATFRLFAPRAREVKLVLFDRPPRRR